ncbi:MAG: hypothetical protein JWM86_889, partial [Thermoleophilia bacterium]|nr:hypothetical protein [Thermoleophilia bacterium]
SDAATAAPRRADLSPGRVTFTRSGSGGALLRVAVANEGDAAAATGTGVLALLDGTVLTSSTLGAIEAGGATVAELELSYCPAGRHALTVVLDAQARLREASETNNAVSRSLVVAC